MADCRHEFPSLTDPGAKCTKCGRKRLEIHQVKETIPFTPDNLSTQSRVSQIRETIPFEPHELSDR